MSRPRLPQEVAKVTGAIVKNAGRFKRRASPKVKSLGQAPKNFTESQTEIWNEFNEDFPWLGRSDRRVVGLAVLLQDQIDIQDDVPVSVYAQMRMLLSAMGGTPVDRSRVVETDGEDEDPSDEFIN